MKDRVNHIKAQYSISHDVFESDYFKNSKHLQGEVNNRLAYMLADEIKKSLNLYETYQVNSDETIFRLDCIVLTVEDWRIILEHLRRTNFEPKIDKL